jgi:hypothetical protein
MTKAPQWAGSDLTVLVSDETYSSARAIVGKLSLGWEIPFPGNGDHCRQGAVRMWRLYPKSDLSQGRQVDWMDLPFANTDCRDLRRPPRRPSSVWLVAASRSSAVQAFSALARIGLTHVSCVMGEE